MYGAIRRSLGRWTQRRPAGSTVIHKDGLQCLVVDVLATLPLASAPRHTSGQIGALTATAALERRLNG
jgi:hypothetical protein